MQNYTFLTKINIFLMIIDLCKTKNPPACSTEGFLSLTDTPIFYLPKGRSRMSVSNINIDRIIIIFILYCEDTKKYQSIIIIRKNNDIDRANYQHHYNNAYIESIIILHIFNKKNHNPLQFKKSYYLCVLHFLCKITKR